MVGTRKLAFEEKDVLGREIAAPTLGGVRSNLSSHPAQGIDPYRMASIMRAAENGNADAYYDLAEEVEEKYLHYQGALGTRKRAVTQLPITVNAAGDDARAQADAELLREVFEIPAVEGALMDILDAIGKGFSVQEIVWDTSKTPWMPTKLINRNQKWFEFDPVDGETLRLKGGEDGAAGMPTDLPPYKFLIHRHKAKTGLTIRGGLARGVAWAWLFQNMSLKDWVIFAEVYGMPLRLGKYDASASEEDKRTLLRAVVGIGTDTAGIIPKSMEMEFVNGASQGNAEIFDRLITVLDQQVSKAVLGQTGTTDATTGGFGSSGAVHNDVREDIQRADAKALAVTLSTLGQWIIDLNHGVPPSGKYPKINLGEEEFFTLDDMTKIERFVEMGGEVEESVVRDKLGLPDPAEKTADGKPVKLLRPKSQAAQDNPTNNPALDTQSDAVGVTVPDGSPKAPLKPLNPVKAPLEGAGVVKGRPIAIGASETLLAPLKAGLEDSQSPSDAIDALIDGLGDEWSLVSAPLLDPLIEAASSAESLEQFRDGLIGVIEGMDTSKITELMAKIQFTARLAGEAGE
jgi:phage gp29-like protein